MSNTTYIITVGETGNEIGHGTTIDLPSDAAAISKAKRLVRAYNGNGWCIVRRDGQTIYNGARAI